MDAPFDIQQIGESADSQWRQVRASRKHTPTGEKKTGRIFRSGRLLLDQMI
jgi:hypothetical protein